MRYSSTSKKDFCFVALKFAGLPDHDIITMYNETRNLIGK